MAHTVSLDEIAFQDRCDRKKSGSSKRPEMNPAQERRTGFRSDEVNRTFIALGKYSRAKQIHCSAGRGIRALRRRQKRKFLRVKSSSENIRAQNQSTGVVVMSGHEDLRSQVGAIHANTSYSCPSNTRRPARRRIRRKEPVKT